MCYISVRLPCGMAKFPSLTPLGGTVLSKQRWVLNQPDPHAATTRETSVFLLAHDFRVCYRGVDIGVLAIPTETAGEEVGCEQGCLEGFACRAGLLQAHPLKGKPGETSSKSQTPLP